MDTAVKKITKIEIKGLWDRFDLTWNLQPDVNILSGINGSGKSTILDCVTEFLVKGTIPIRLSNLVRTVKITFDNGKYILEEFKKEKITEKTGLKINQITIVRVTDTTLDHDLIKINRISTFDKEIIEAGNRPDEKVRTELDRDIFELQTLYLDYQLNIGKKVVEAISESKENSHEAVARIREKQELFLKIMDDLFKDTNKKINRAKNEIAFLVGKKEISAYKLSSGEKQMLVILLTVLIQDNKPAILLMDEPEVSLHFDWQKKLLGYITALNPNIQVILATHSPAIIIEGWRDKVKEVRDLITKDTLNPQ